MHGKSPIYTLQAAIRIFLWDTPGHRVTHTQRVSEGPRWPAANFVRRLHVQREGRFHCHHSRQKQHC